MLQEHVEGLQAEVQRALSAQQAAVQDTAAATDEAPQERQQHEREQAQQASLRWGPCKLIQVLQHRQGLCWQHKLGHNTYLLPDTLWPRFRMADCFVLDLL